MSQGQDKFYWMPHKQDYEMCCCIQETTLRFQEQSGAGTHSQAQHDDSTCHTFTITCYLSKTGRIGMTSMQLTSCSQTFHPLLAHCWIQVFGQQDRQCEFSYLVPVYWCVSEFDTDIMGTLTPTALRIRLLMAACRFLQSV